MTTFTVTGLRGSVMWQDGELVAGDPAAIALVDELISVGEELAQTPTGPFYRAALEPDYVAFLTMLEAVGRAEAEVSGDIPAFPDDGVPPGAVP